MYEYLQMASRQDYRVVGRIVQIAVAKYQTHVLAKLAVSCVSASVKLFLRKIQPIVKLAHF